ncbi:MAG: DUF2589 domain-containing protein [Cytophagales bacterium]|jgi:hypothetical protein|nr:DUF2589 domain-containing protein [Cytophagales bacterium]MCA6495631.1 DUF2589 domain-containing protein [Chitinophagaceae bacterium]MCA6388137.1 DUF2589 domain-containing protein [Cytophagales bacterium]MCA6391906.1 DUF2589 domain-containing protein [Cytophagales bacterium]MCA6395378.1 DUF2589 domain-containing protein [Cytophagales bacterium]
MIGFDDFIKAIHDAVLAANNSLSERNIDLFSEYFEDSGQAAEMQESVDSALKATQDILNNPRPGRDSFANVKKSLEEASRALSGESGGDSKNMKAFNTQTLMPKTVKLEYASNTEEGVKPHYVNVPLITLIPMPSTQISQARFKTMLEVQEENGRLMISFPNRTQLSSETPPTNAISYFTEFEVVLEPRKETEGLRKVVEGYEKILRAQMPH